MDWATSVWFNIASRHGPEHSRRAVVGWTTHIHHPQTPPPFRSVGAIHTSFFVRMDGWLADARFHVFRHVGPALDTSPTIMSHPEWVSADVHSRFLSCFDKGLTHITHKVAKAGHVKRMQPCRAKTFPRTCHRSAITSTGAREPGLGPASASPTNRS